MLIVLIALAAIPIVLHLLMLHRLKTVELSTYRFLFDSYVQQRRRMRFLEALLAMLRAAFLLFLRAAPISRVENDAVSGFQRSNFVRRRRRHAHACLINGNDGTDMDFPVARASTLYHVLMVHTGYEIGSKAAGVDLLEFQLLARRDG